MNRWDRSFRPVSQYDSHGPTLRSLFALVLVALILSPVTAPFQTYKLVQKSSPIARDTDAGTLDGVGQPAVRRTITAAIAPSITPPAPWREPAAAPHVSTRTSASRTPARLSVLRI